MRPALVGKLHAVVLRRVVGRQVVERDGRRDGGRRARREAAVREAAAEAVNGLRGTRLGATKGAASPKHRASACKALLLERFRELCAALPAEALPEPLRAVGDVRRRSYRELKLVATDYQRRKDASLGLPAFRDWVHCPPCCEEFS